MKALANLFALSIAIFVLSAISPVASFAQNQTAAELAAEEKLITDFTDPLTTLPQISIRDSFTPANYGTDVQTNQVILRPIIPRLPQYSLFPFVQLIRPTFTLVTVPYPKGDTRTEFGDMQLFDLAVLPWPARGTGLLMGVGPMFVFPTASSRSAGQGAWQAGPAI
ncbi:MAG TPA: hypothetical protein VGI29_11510, partial [Candidatus Binataceae bacterium]